jgi:menaquinone-specific isochorismate synthase
MELLARNELWERGYFASPLGFTFGKTGESCFVVGIRSCLISQEKVHVFAGAGYVAGSSADDEWDETQVKIDSVLQIFGDLKRAE